MITLFINETNIRRIKQFLDYKIQKKHIVELEVPKECADKIREYMSNLDDIVINCLEDEIFEDAQEFTE